MSLPTCEVVRLGLVDYHQALDLQRVLVDGLCAGKRPDILILLEHPHVYTIGRRGTREQVLLDDEALRQAGIALYETDRGGQATYHGPGQLVAYPILNLKEWGGPLKYIRALEQVILQTLTDFGIPAGLIDGLTGVWVRGEKIGAIGVKISRGVAYHGLSLNVNVDLSYFDHIIPCGIDQARVTSMEKVLGAPVEEDLVSYGLAYHFGRELGLRMVEGKPLADDLLPLTQVTAG